MTLSQLIAINKISYGEAAKAAGCDKAVISKIIGRTYPNWEAKEKEIVDKLLETGIYSIDETNELRINTDVVVPTRGLSDFKSLADDLADPESSLSSSIGMGIGSAERGKTHAAKWYCRENERASYVLYVDGSTKVMLLRDICFKLAGVRPISFDRCMLTIEECCKYSRRLIVIDEADKMPISLLEMIRGINERCSLPFLLVGEEGLKAKCGSVPRLHSRIRRPVCVFEPLTSLDVAAFYQLAAAVPLEKGDAETLVRHAGGGFRSVVNDSLAIAKIARASGIASVTSDMIKKITA